MWPNAARARLECIRLRAAGDAFRVPDAGLARGIEEAGGTSAITVADQHCVAASA